MTPAKAQAIYEQALAQHRAGDLEAADRLYKRILRARPSHAGALQHSGILALQAGDLDKAADLLERAAKLAPRDAGLALNLAFALKLAGRHDQALAAYGRAAALDPSRAETEAEAGHLLLELGRPEEALQAFERALEKRPGEAAFLNDRGNALVAMRRWQAAHESFDAALAIDPGLAVVRANRGAAALRLGRLEEAVQDQLEAVRDDPEAAGHRLNLGGVLAAMGRYDEALAAFDSGLRRSPDNPDLRFSRALLLLRLGRFEEGWADFEARKRRRPPIAAEYAEHPEWDGSQDVAGKILLLHWEQGFGDTIQFGRYASLAADRGARVLLQVQAPLEDLMRRLDPRVEVIGEHDTPPVFDLHAPLMSLPRAFGTQLDTIPAQASYLTADPILAEAWRAKLGTKGRRLRLGLVWRGAARHENDSNRSLPSAILDELLKFGVDWVSLQKDETDEEMRLLSAAGALPVGNALGTFSDTAAVLACLDGLVSVDTSVAHLAGALGKRGWMLLPFDPDWRWMLGRDDSPWYPSLRLARQSAPGDWAPALAQLRQSLESA